MLKVFLIILLQHLRISHGLPKFVSCRSSYIFEECRSLSFNEELLPGTVVDTYTFNDTGASSFIFSLTFNGNNLLNYTYLSLNTKSTSADLVISSRIDAEYFRYNSMSLYFTIFVTGSEKKDFEFFTHVSDIDDVYPVFLNVSPSCNMPEFNINASCSNMILMDEDITNNIENFQIVSSTTGSPNDFGIQKVWSNIIDGKYFTSFTLTLNTVLNYDISRMVGVVVQVQDSAIHTVLNSFSIIVFNSPHRPPIFQNLPYILNIEEALPPNTTLITVKAIDGDVNINSPISYSFNDNTFSQYFSINSTSGVITVMNLIIRESVDISAVYGQFNLVVIASKSQQIPSNTSTAVISVQIIDINNSPAIFSQNIYNGSVLQNSSIGTVILVQPQIFVTDKDLGINGQFSVALLNGTSSDVFDIYPKIGFGSVILTLMVKNSLSLDYSKTQFFNVTIQTSQLAPGRNISQYSYASVNVAIIQINVFTPVFNKSSYSFSILENSPIKTNVGTIQATDMDLGIFGSISYYISDSSQKFTINSTTGDIFVNVDSNLNSTLLNAKITQTYTLTGQAKDGGGLMSYTIITINLIDTNINPPVFKNKIYYTEMIEKTLSFIPPLLQVQATDADIYPINRIISYSLFNITYDSPALLSSFIIDNNTGIVSVVKLINRDTLNQSNNNFLYIFIKAFDPFKTTFYDYCVINLRVEDINDNAPILTNKSYFANIPQNISSSTPILTFSATDMDQVNTINTLITYKLIGDDASSFLIKPFSNVTSGAFLIKDPNAALNVRLYNFTVEADDHGISPLNGTATIIIGVNGINNRSPVFNSTIFQYTVSENISVGTTFGQVVALDPDYNANLSYSLVQGTLKAWSRNGTEVQNIYNIATLFGLNSSSGLIMTLATLDYETSIRIEVQVMVVDLASQTQNQTATATIVLLISDVNDNPPVFQVNMFKLSLLEDFSIANNVTTGATGLFTLATDIDTVGVLRYNYSETSNSFTVDPVTAQVFLIKALDREKVGFLNFTVWCNDGVHTAIALVSVTILDVNDNEPTFNGFPSNITISQNTQVGTILQRFNATDLDIGENARLAFRINGGEIVQFALSSDGNLSLANSLLLSAAASYLIFIEVYDNPSGPYHLRSDKQLLVLITLVNTAPTFPFQFYEYNIPENVVIGFKLDEINAKDNDFNENGRLSYYLILPVLNPNPTGLTLFSMNFVSNWVQILVNSSLKYKAGTYIIIVRAMDNGTPRLDANFTMFINVTAINYYPPNFTNPVVSSFNQTLPTFSILENNVGIVANIAAFDPDGGINGVVRFSLEPLNEDNANFTINALNGTLANLAPFDREVKSLYKCRIKAFDLGTPSLTTFVTILVTILDVNDNPPIFAAVNKSITLSINEGTQVMSSIFNTQLFGVKIGNVARAVDYDLNDNNTPCYFMMKNITALYLVPNTGDLYGLIFFDVNVNSEYQSGIKVVPLSQCSSGMLYMNTNYNVSDPTQALLTLKILDINNNPPYFTRTSIIEPIPRFNLPGTLITDFTKYSGDIDSVSQGQLKYFIQGDIKISSPLISQLQDEKYNQIFSLNSTNGILSIASGVSFVNSMQGYFQMIIAVTDGKFTTTTPYMTYLVSQSQRLVMVVNDYLPNVFNKTDQITTYLTQQLSVNILVDGLDICTDIYTNIIVGCTYVYMHGFNTTSNKVMDGSSLLYLFGGKSSSMVELNSTYKITYVMLASRNLSSLLDSSALQQAITYRLILIIISSIFLLVVIVVGSLICVFRINYERKLKAYTTSSYDNTTVLKSMNLPGTNLYENSKNPFANSGVLDNGSNDHVPKKYGVPTFGDGLAVERSIVSLGKLGDESAIIDSSETVF